MSKVYELKQDEYLTEDLYVEKGTLLPLSPYVDDRLLQVNELKGWVPVIVEHGKSLWTGDLEELPIQTHWFSANNLKEVQHAQNDM